jgi:hypothetical protein
MPAGVLAAGAAEYGKRNIHAPGAIGCAATAGGAGRLASKLLCDQLRSLAGRVRIGGQPRAAE